MKSRVINVTDFHQLQPVRMVAAHTTTVAGCCAVSHDCRISAKRSTATMETDCAKSIPPTRTLAREPNKPEVEVRMKYEK